MKPYFFRLLFVSPHCTVELEDSKYDMTVPEVKQSVAAVLAMKPNMQDVSFGPIVFRDMPPEQLARLQDYLAMWMESFTVHHESI